MQRHDVIIIWIPSQRASDRWIRIKTTKMRLEILFIASLQILLKQADLPVIWNAMMLIWRHSKDYKPIVSY